MASPGFKGDDEPAPETAALGAGAGLRVTLATVNPLGLGLRSAQTIGGFDPLFVLSAWRISPVLLPDPARLPDMGV